MDTPKRDARRRRQLPPNVVPLRAFVEVGRLMRKLGMSPADCLELLADVLADFERRADEHEAKHDANFPLWVLGEQV